jgi:hypothetical protein
VSVQFAYLAAGKLFVKDGESDARAIESKFGQSLRDRATQIHDRNAWKTQGSGARFMSGGLLWGAQNRVDPAAIPILITGISRGCAPGELLYALETSEIGGIFRLRNQAMEEQRLLHTADFRMSRLQASTEADRIACVLRHKAGNSCIAVMRSDGSDLAEVTQGDAMDDAPAWVAGSSDELVFQSAAIGRNQAGIAAGQAPFTIQKLNLTSGEMTTLAEDPQFDLLCPQVSHDRSLYYIRRPYQNPDQRPRLWGSLLDLVLLPFRLLYALFQYLNFFTARYTGKTLTSAGGARQQQADVRQMMIWGNLIEAQSATPEKEGSAGALVPSNWELIRQQKDGSTQVIARGVLSFDLCSDGSLLYSNGNAVHWLLPEGKTQVLAREHLVQQVVVISPI